MNKVTAMEGDQHVDISGPADDDKNSFLTNGKSGKIVWWLLEKIHEPVFFYRLAICFIS